MGVSIEDIKKLNELNGIGLDRCQKALVEAEGDFDKARGTAWWRVFDRCREKDRETREASD